MRKLRLREIKYPPKVPELESHSIWTQAGLPRSYFPLFSMVCPQVLSLTIWKSTSPTQVSGDFPCLLRPRAFTGGRLHLSSPCLPCHHQCTMAQVSMSSPSCTHCSICGSHNWPHTSTLPDLCACCSVSLACPLPVGCIPLGYRPSYNLPIYQPPIPEATISITPPTVTL